MSQLGEQARKIGRIVLEIAVECGDQGALGGAESGQKGGALTAIDAVSYPTDVRVGALCLLDPSPRLVGASVVDKP
jgi:hypothetical protein